MRVEMVNFIDSLLNVLVMAVVIGGGIGLIYALIVQRILKKRFKDSVECPTCGELYDREEWEERQKGVPK